MNIPKYRKATGRPASAICDGRGRGEERCRVSVTVFDTHRNRMQVAPCQALRNKVG